MALEPLLLNKVMVGEGMLPEDYKHQEGPDEMYKALRKTLVYDRDSGSWFYSTANGDLQEVPVDEAGIPLYDIMDYVPPKAKGNGD